MDIHNPGHGYRATAVCIAAVLSFVDSLQWNDIIRTVILTTVGTMVSFMVSFLMKQCIKKLKR